MSKLLLHKLRPCRSSCSASYLFQGVLLHKKFANLIVPAACYVNKSPTKSSTTLHLTEDVEKIALLKPKSLPPWKPTPSVDRTNLLMYYQKLSKRNLTGLVVVTSFSGYFMAPAAWALDTLLLSTIGTGLLSAAANTINQFHEVPFDAQMNRTKQRVLVCGQLTQLHAMLFAAGTSLTGLSLLYYGVNGLTGTLGLANLILYTGIYTPMKRISILNTWVGSIVGAIPPLMGWAACAGSLGPGAWLMAALLYSWQFPHFNALSWNLRPDYSRAGYRMTAVTNPGLCKRVALRHTVALQAICTLAPILDVTHYWFLLGATPLNLYFTYLAYDFYKDASSKTSKMLFRFSIVHLPILMALLLLCKKRPSPEDKELRINEENELPTTELS